ncbi:hypothetical protein C0584_00745 [Candidatus Parcubacteria bacterium]|nr:MAG: hypothetical protein C0584_00745 [Candidatus Parcubacteria bacterium]
MQKNEKLAFAVGLSVGVAAISLLGLIVLGVLYLKNNQVELVRNELDSEKIVKVDDRAGDGLISVERIDLHEERVAGVWVRGNTEALVSITEYSDIQCPYCAKHHETLKQVMEEYPNQVKWEYKHFPLDSLHPYARKAAEAAECAGEQEDFWHYIDTLYANQKSLNADIFEKVAIKIGLNVDQFNACIDSGRYSEKVAADLSEGQERGVRGTPGNFVNGEELKGAVPFSQMKAAVDKALN